MLRGQNHRFTPNPDYVRTVANTEQVIDALNEAVQAGKRVVVRSGGHCFEDFTASPDVEVLIDMSAMDDVFYDAERSAFAVGPGSTLGHVYTMLFKGWGVTIPAGECTEVGAGGHIAGGGYGPLSRRYGSVVDYLYGVEVVVVDESGTARAVVATREPDDPHRDLWWAHTGGGGGNFGVVTRYWLRSPGATAGGDPASMLPKAPGMTRTRMLMWPWDSLTEEDFAQIVRNFGGWFERNSAEDSPYVGLNGFFHGAGRTRPVMVGSSIDPDVHNSSDMMDAYFEAISQNVSAKPMDVEWTQPWLYTTAFPGFGDLGDYMTRRLKIKAAYLRKSYTDQQIAVAHRYLTSQDGDPSLILIGYGGNVNTVDPAATATAQRDSVMKVIVISVWGSEAEDEERIARIREFYRDIYGETGGVPAPNEVSDGSYINYPDSDLADPAWNTSGVPWHTLYYKDNYPRLQEVKKRYDPRNVFKHALSIELPE
jgi:aclacinomycin oxidase